MSVSNQIKYWCVAHDLPILERLPKPPAKEEEVEESAPSSSALVDEEPSVTEILTQFNDNLQKKAPRTSMVKPESGSTGFTFICSSLHRQQQRHFILKWDTEVAGINQKMCSDLVKHCGLSAPTIQVVTGPLAHKLKRRAKKVSPDMNDGLTLIYMPSFAATTFSSARRSGYLSDLTTKSMGRVFIKSGGILLMDLVMGNADRLFEADWLNGKNGLKVHFNDGNLMLEMPYRRSKRALKAVHFIDNGTDKSLLKSFQEVEKEIEESDGDDGVLLEEESGASAESDSPSLADFQKGWGFLQENFFLSGASWKATVRDLTKDPRPLITVAAEGIAKSFKEGELAIPLKKITSLLKKGFEYQIKQIKRCDLREIERTMQAEIPAKDVHTSTLKHMMENLEIVRSIHEYQS